MKVKSISFFLFISLSLASTRTLAADRLWKLSDPLFDDLNRDGIMDINVTLKREAETVGINIPLKTTWFKPLRITGKPLGYYMPYFLDATSFESFCLNSEHYYSANPLYRILGRFLPETEGLFLGTRHSQESFNIVAIGERELKSKWYIYRHGVPSTPTNEELRSHRVYFKHKGLTYEVRKIEDITGEHSSQFPAHDLKVGCVPAVRY